MALPATDVFTGSDGTALTTYSANWTNNQGAFKIGGNAVTPNADGDDAAHWNADAFANDQYAQGVIGAIGTAVYIGVAVRCAASAATFYSFTGNSNDASYLSKYVAGSYTDLGSAAAFTAGQTVRIEAEGTTVRCKINGTTVISVTDTGIASGSAGVAGAGTVATSTLDNWEGGNLSAATKAPAPRRRQRQWRRAL